MSVRTVASALLFLLGAASTRSASAFTAPRTGGCSLASPAIHLANGRFEARKTAPATNPWSHRDITRTPASTSTSLAATQLPLAAIGAGIAKFYKAFPLAAGFLTASTKAGFADSLAQRRDVCTTKFDFRRNLAMVLYSGCVLGISCEIMYNRIFPVVFGTNPTLARAVKMTVFDGLVNAPTLWLPPAYLFQALVFRSSKREALQKYVTDVKENGLLTKYWSLWMPVQMINFVFVPAHFRIAFVAMVSFFWMIILSIVANNSKDPDSCPVEPEPVLLNPRALD